MKLSKVFTNNVQLIKVFTNNVIHKMYNYKKIVILQCLTRYMYVCYYYVKFPEIYVRCKLSDISALLITVKPVLKVIL